MIRFGHGRTLCRGNKFQLLTLILCFACILISCEGRSYKFSLSSEDLEADLLSIDVVCIDNEGNPLSFETVCVVDENDVPKIVETIASLDYTGIDVPRSGFYIYAFKFNYPQNYIVISRGEIYYLDENLNQYYGHELYGNFPEIVDLLSDYIPLEDMDGFADYRYDDGSTVERPE